MFAARYDWLDELERLLTRAEDIAYVQEVRDDPKIAKRMWDAQSSILPEYC
jgi:hypothetical protein